MYALDLSRAQWRKSSRTHANGNCVEVAQVDDSIAIRDSKLAKGAGFPTLAVSRSDWNSLLTTLNRSFRG